MRAFFCVLATFGVFAGGSARLGVLGFRALGGVLGLTGGAFGGLGAFAGLSAGRLFMSTPAGGTNTWSPG